MFTTGLMLLVYVPKIVLTLFMFGEDIFRIGASILNYFDNRSTNASAESFNAKIKAFRSQFRGVRKVDFFLFRLSNIFA